LAEELPSGRVPRALQLVSARLEAGDALEQALRAPGVHLPEHVRGLVLAGLAANQLADSMEQFVHLQRLSAGLRRQVRLILAYPLALLALLGVLLFLYEHYFIRQLADVYRGIFDFTTAADLPLATQFVLRLSEPAAWWWLVALGGVLAATLLARLAPVRPHVDSAMKALPILGPLWHWAALAEFCRLLGLLLEVSVPLPRAIEMTAAGLRDSGLGRACRTLARRVEAGASLDEALAASPAFSASLVPIVRWGLQMSALPEALRAAGEMFEGRVRIQLALVRTFLAPLTFLLVSGVVVFLAYAAFSIIIPLLNWMW
jgi:type II secretory pathway component PulF